MTLELVDGGNCCCYCCCGCWPVQLLGLWCCHWILSSSSSSTVRQTKTKSEIQIVNIMAIRMPKWDGGFITFSLSFRHEHIVIVHCHWCRLTVLGCSLVRWLVGCYCYVLCWRLVVGCWRLLLLPTTTSGQLDSLMVDSQCRFSSSVLIWNGNDGGQWTEELLGFGDAS